MNGSASGPAPEARGHRWPGRAGCPLAVVLVAPEIPENLGFIARTLACYGITDLRIVDRPDIAHGEAARRTASGGEGVLAKARSFTGIGPALADCLLAFGFSRRPRHPSQAILDLSEAVSLAATVGNEGSAIAPAASSHQSLALVFGCESQGLSRDHALSMSHLVRIPYADPVLSLNLSHAVAIAVHAFSSIPPAHAEQKEIVTDITSERRATLGESHKLLADLLVGLKERSKFRPAKVDAQMEYVRALWQRLQPTEKEAEFLAGLIRKNL